MKESRMRTIGFLVTFVIVMAVYFYTVAPTAAFWDCGELIAASYIMGVPHPPGTPLFVAIGRIFAMVPFAAEPAFRVNFIPVLFGAFSCGLIYLIVVKLISVYATSEKERLRWLPHVAGVFAGLACAFAYSVWDNCVEAEVYGPCMVVALSVLYMALLWRDKVESGSGDNRLMLAAIFLLFLATGIHFTPMMTVFAILVFALIVDRESVLHLRIFEFIAFYLIALTVGEMGFTAAMFVTVIMMLAAAYFGIKMLETADRGWKLLTALGLLSLLFIIGYGAAGNGIMDDTVLLLASPTVALMERWVRSPASLVLLVAGYGGYLYWLHRQGKLRPKYVALMLGLMLVAGSVQFIMMVRARQNPGINEVDPSSWRSFVSVLKREQYDPMKLLPRKTQFLTEEEWRMNQNPRFSVAVAYFEQIKFYLRYFFWQWGNERFFDIFLRIRWQALLGLIPPLLGLWGMWHQFKRDKRSFSLIFVAFLVASLGLVTYLNLKYSPSDPRRGDPAQGKLGYLEVRERDYFYAFSFVFYAVFVGIGAYAFLRRMAGLLRSRRLPSYAAAGALLAFGFVPMMLNYKTVTRRGDWIPAEYGHNMLVSCPGEHAVVFTNGDNDTFPLWFTQTVPSRVAGYDPKFGKNVAVGILSLLNTNWYAKQLKRWGAPISFTEAEIDRLPPGFVGKQGKTFLREDIMIRDIVATSAGIKLKWPDDYGSTPEEFQQKVFANGYDPKSPVYFATTVGREKLQDIGPHLRLEGLVYRVVAQAAPGEVDLKTSRELLFEKYRMTSMLDPKLPKDENTRGLLLTYAASYMALMGEYRRLNRFQEARDVAEQAMKLDLERDRKVALYYHFAVASMQLGDYDRALQVLDTVKKLGYKEPEFAVSRAYAWEAKGDYAKAEEAYLEAIGADPRRGEAIQALARMYMEKTFDTARARQLLQQRLRQVPSDSASAQTLRLIS